MKKNKRYQFGWEDWRPQPSNLEVFLFYVVSPVLVAAIVIKLFLL